MRLSVVIPAWNDPEGLSRLVPQLLGLGRLAEVIIVDDASDVPVSAVAIGLPRLAQDPRLVWLRSADHRGAGHARNLGIRHATGSHLLFVDSDDLITPGLADLIADLEAKERSGASYDFCIFRHVDSRVRAMGGLGPLQSDQRLWDAVGAGVAPGRLTRAQAVTLCRIAAYPWNKIYRTGFLRDAGIRCTEIPVHNDIELHWMSFLKAGVILASSRVCAEHFVHPAGKRLTNRAGTERFRVFEAFDALFDELARHPNRVDFLEPLSEFCTRLFGWITDTVAPEHRAPFRHLARAYMMRRMTRPMFALVALRNPAAAAQINRLIAGQA